MLSMVGMNASITRDVTDFHLAVGSPAKNVKLNLLGIKRKGIEIGDWVAELSKPPSEWDQSVLPLDFLEFFIANGGSFEVEK
jgi:hypothetical protein